MAHPQHEYVSSIRWTGNRGPGNKEYRGYDRTWDIVTPGKPVINCSNDPMLGGNPALPNPEDLLLSCLSSCHMLWYLHLACTSGVVVLGYEDSSLGIGETEKSGAGRFVSAVLRPKILLAPGSDPQVADAIHHRIHEYCFIARSVNFPVTYAATYEIQPTP